MVDTRGLFNAIAMPPAGLGAVQAALSQHDGAQVGRGQRDSWSIHRSDKHWEYMPGDSNIRANGKASTPADWTSTMIVSKSVQARIIRLDERAAVLGSQLRDIHLIG